MGIFGAFAIVANSAWSVLVFVGLGGVSIGNYVLRSRFDHHPSRRDRVAAAILSAVCGLALVSLLVLSLTQSDSPNSRLLRILTLCAAASAFFLAEIFLYRARYFSASSPDSENESIDG
jgi:hypothetical protein